MQYEQYEQEVKNLQKMIEEAQRVVQDRPVATGNIHELQTQIQHHEVSDTVHLLYTCTLTNYIFSFDLVLSQMFQDANSKQTRIKRGVSLTSSELHL